VEGGHLDRHQLSYHFTSRLSDTYGASFCQSRAPGAPQIPEMPLRIFRSAR
jgi:hypothetical protein